MQLTRMIVGPGRAAPAPRYQDPCWAVLIRPWLPVAEGITRCTDYALIARTDHDQLAYSTQSLQGIDNLHADKEGQKDRLSREVTCYSTRIYIRRPSALEKERNSI